MKKIWLALAGMILAFSASAAQITDGKQYTISGSTPVYTASSTPPLISRLQVNLRSLSSSHSTARTAISLKKCCTFPTMYVRNCLKAPK